MQEKCFPASIISGIQFKAEIAQETHFSKTYGKQNILKQLQPHQQLVGISTQNYRKEQNFMHGCIKNHYTHNQKGDNLLQDQFRTRIMNQSIKFIILSLHKDKDIRSNIQTVLHILLAIIYKLPHIHCWLLYTNCHTYFAGYYIQTVTHILQDMAAL